MSKNCPECNDEMDFAGMQFRGIFEDRKYRAEYFCPTCNTVHCYEQKEVVIHDIPREHDKREN
jgi:hypothetical protein